MSTIVATTKPKVLASRMEIVATVTYPSIGITTRTRWQGASEPGFPGPVLWESSDGTWHRVDSPLAFGDTFGAEWLERFYA